MYPTRWSRLAQVRKSIEGRSGKLFMAFHLKTGLFTLYKK